VVVVVGRDEEHLTPEVLQQMVVVLERQEVEPEQTERPTQAVVVVVVAQPMALQPEEVVGLV
jgi:hypothetical protein